MARHGENIRERTDGRWEGRYKVYSDEKGRHLYRSVYGNTYAVVKEKLIAAKLTLKKNLLTGSTEDTGGKSAARACDGILFSEVAMEWLVEKLEKCKYSTYIKYETVYRKHLSDFLGGHPLSEMESKIGLAGDGNILPEISDHLFSDNISESLQKSICCVANQIFRHANQKYDLQIPFLKRPAMKTKRRAIETFTNSERLRLFSTIYNSPDKYGIATVFCLHTGLRIGELCSLRWTDFNFKEMTLAVERTVQRIAFKNSAAEPVFGEAEHGWTISAKDKRQKTFLMETEPKSESSRRTIPLPEKIMGLLDNLNKDEPYIFGGKHPLEPRTLQYRFKKMLEKTKISHRKFHMLRHTFATSCIESGMDVKSLCEILGHSDVKITMNRYVHPTMDYKRKHLETLAGFYGQICGQTA